MKKPAIIVFLLFLAVMLVVGLTDARAQPTTGYDELFCFTRSYGSWTIDSVIFRLFESTLAPDSGAILGYDTARYTSRVDTLCFVVNLSATTISKLRNPSILGVAFLDNGEEVHEVKSVAHLVHAVDTARSANASLVIDSASLAAIIAAINAGLGGSGDYPETLFVYDSLQDALVMGARVAVFAPDTGSYQNGSGMQTTDMFGKVIYSLDAGTFPVAVSATGFFQAGAYQLVTQAAPGGRDTVFVYSFNPSLIAGPDSCILVIHTNVPYCEGFFTIDQPEKGPLRTSAGLYLDKNEKSYDGDANGIIQAPLVVSSSTTPTCTYHIVVKNTKGQEIAEWNRYVVPDSATATLIAEE